MYQKIENPSLHPYLIKEVHTRIYQKMSDVGGYPWQAVLHPSLHTFASLHEDCYKDDKDDIDDKRCA